MLLVSTKTSQLKDHHKPICGRYMCVSSRMTILLILNMKDILSFASVFINCTLSREKNANFVNTVFFVEFPTSTEFYFKKLFLQRSVTNLLDAVANKYSYWIPRNFTIFKHIENLFLLFVELYVHCSSVCIRKYICIHLLNSNRNWSQF